MSRTTISVIQQGKISVNVDNAVVVVQHEDIALVTIDLHSKYVETVGWSCEDNAPPNIGLSPGEGSLHLVEAEHEATVISLVDFPGWRIALANCARYTLTLCLLNLSEDKP